MTDLLPVRLTSEVAFCPRMFALEYVHAEMAADAAVLHGRFVHRRVDTPAGDAPTPGDEAPAVVRSLELGDPTLGITARIDLCDFADGHAVPVDYKRGSPPNNPERAWLQPRVQLCMLGLLLRAHGWRCDHGILWYAATRERVRVDFDAELEAQARRVIAQARAITASPDLPPPLQDDPKCGGCSLVGICLPDETAALTRPETRPLRPLVAARDDGSPLVVTRHPATVGKDGDEIVVREKGGPPIARHRLADCSQLVVYGGATVTTPLLHALAERDIPVAFHTWGGWYVGSFAPASGVGALLRAAQHRLADDPGLALAAARPMIQAKIHNARVLMRRNGSGVPQATLSELEDLRDAACRAPDIDTLLGLEGRAARTYFAAWTHLLDGTLGFDFEGRNRRPPRDPVNALLSFAYGVLVREVSHVIGRIGLDPARGVLHQPRYARPALALDLMEEMRPVIADSAVITAINTRVVQLDDFEVRATGVALRDAGRRRFLEVLDRRLDAEAQHPRFGTKWSMRRHLEVQARLFSRLCLGELTEYPGYRTR